MIIPNEKKSLKRGSLISIGFDAKFVEGGPSIY
jgi:hypothetical protein